MSAKQKVRPIVFCLDDDSIFNKIIISVLNKFGFYVETFESPELFLERIHKLKPDLCLIDLNLSANKSGLDTIQKIRDNGLLSFPIFIASTTNDRNAIAHALEIGANDYLIKPLDRDVLIAKLHRYFKTNELELTKMSSPSIQTTDISTNLILDSKIQEIDELGLTLLTSHLIPKGFALTLSGEVLEKITGRAKPLLLTSVSSSIEPNTQLFQTYLEFDINDHELGNHIRTWISNYNKSI